MPQAIPITSEAELAGRNSGLDMVASNLMVFDMLGHATVHISAQRGDNGVMSNINLPTAWLNTQGIEVRSIDTVWDLSA